MGDPLHLHCILNDASPFLSVKGVCVSLLIDRDYTEVDALCEAGIEDDLFVTVKTPLPQRRKIEESEIHRLLYLVDEIITEKDMGYMGFLVAYAGCLLRVMFRVQEKMKETVF
jgi:hypothetical protein